MLATVFQVLFALMLAGNMIAATTMMKLASYLPLSKRKTEGIALIFTQLAWRMTLMFSPWVSTLELDNSADWGDIVKGLDTLVDKPDGSGKCPRPLFILGNHTSFFDTLFSVIKMPSSVIWNVRTYMKGELFNMPILGTMCRCIGHFGVWFKSGEDGSFKVDETKMEAENLRVDAHLSNGGYLSFFPEGQINKNPEKLMPLRYGGFKKALEYDAKIVSFVTFGNPTIWPAKAAVGGLPGKVVYSTKMIAPNGAKALAAELRKKEPSSDKPDQQLLSEAIQVMMQEQLDELKTKHEGKPMLSNKKAN